MPEHKKPYGLDAHEAIRDPSVLPDLLIRNIYGVMKSSKKGDLYDKWVKGFNIAVWTQRTTKPPRIEINGNSIGGITLSHTGRDVWVEKNRTRTGKQKTEEARMWVFRWAAQIRRNQPDVINAPIEES